MTIDPLNENLIWPTEATSLYPRGPNGKKVHVSRVYRDMHTGRNGIILESICTPRLATSRQAVASFFQRLTQISRPAAPAAPSDVATERANHVVEQELDRLGF